MNPPRIFAAERPSERKALAEFRSVAPMKATAEAVEVLESLEPGCVEPKRRRFNGMRIVARRYAPGWLAVFVRSLSDATLLRMHDAFAEQPNPNHEQSRCSVDSN